MLTADKGDIPKAEILEATARVLASESFSSSPRLQQFLSFIVEKTCDGETDQLKEYSIALAVFDRAPSFDSRTDTIVRVHARRLRQQLNEYYRGEGQFDSLVIDLPKGGYVPAFRSRGVGAGIAIVESREHGFFRHRRRALAVGAALLASAAAYFALAGSGALPWTRVPSRWTLEGSTLRVFDSSDRLCWERRLPPLHSSYDALASDKAAIGDIDGDGKVEVLFNYLPENLASRGGSVMCFRQDGTLRWEHRLGEMRTFGARKFDGNYGGRFLRALTAGGRRLVLTIATHYIWYPARAALLDPATGRVVEEYWHPGHIYKCLLSDIDHDGADEVVFAALNNPGNGIGHAAVGVLKLPFSRTPRLAAADSAFPAVTGGGEAAYALLPTSDTNAVMGATPVPSLLSRDAWGRIIFQTTGAESTSITYYLDSRLQVLEYRATDNFPALHNRLRHQGLLDHALSEAETAALGRAVAFPAAPDGNSPALQRLFGVSGE